MKSIIISTMMIFFTFVLFLSFSWYVQYDHNQNTIEMAVKRALMSTMIDYVDELDFEAYDVLNTFEKHFKDITPTGFNYQIALTGFINEPLFMQVEVKAENQTKLKAMRIHVREAMIEELKDEEQ